MFSEMSDMGMGMGMCGPYKVLVVGDAGVGKTCVIRRFVHNVFQVSTKSTIGIDFAMKMVQCDDGEQATLQVWDIAGQERCGQMTRVYYQAAVGALVVFDMSKQDSLHAALRWKLDLDSKAALRDGSPLPCLLVGNKCDIEPVGVSVMADELTQICTDHGFVGWAEASAKKNVGIGATFRRLTDQIRANEKLLVPDEVRAEANLVQIASIITASEESSRNGRKKKKCACSA